MNLWINSKATHWTDTEIVHVYCVMDGPFRLSDWYDTYDKAVWCKDHQTSGREAA